MQPKKVAKTTGLPWLTVPVATAPTEAVPLAAVRGLAPSLATALHSAGYTSLLPVQAAVWHVLAGGLSCRHDLCIAAPTGSGKTLAYALPLLQRCVAQPAPGLRGLVVVPTRALAQQVRRSLGAFSSHQHRRFIADWCTPRPPVDQHRLLCCTVHVQM